MGFKVLVSGKIGSENYNTTLTSSDNQIVTDTPVKYGGSDAGLNLFEILASSLASCTLITLRLYVERKKWDVPEIKLKVDLERDLTTNKTTFNLYLDLENSGLSDKEKQRMLEIAEKCPVHKTLKNNIKMFSELKSDVI